MNIQLKTGHIINTEHVVMAWPDWRVQNITATGCECRYTIVILLDCKYRGTLGPENEMTFWYGAEMDKRDDDFKMLRDALLTKPVVRT